jgi:Protein of unknown function (DUF1616)
MTSTSLLEAGAGLLLLFFVPGYATTRAIFPEWRLRGPDPWRTGLETVTLSFVLSIGWTVVVGYLLLQGSGAGFQADWAHPQLELGLTLVALGAFLIGWAEGAYARKAPSPRRATPDPGGEGAWELSRRLDRLDQEERRLEHQLRVASRSTPAAGELRSRLTALQEESSRLRRAREEEYAQ